MCALSNSLISIWLWKKTKPSNISITAAALEFSGSPYLSVRLSGGVRIYCIVTEKTNVNKKTESTREYILYSLDRYGRMGVRGGVIGISN